MDDEQDLPSIISEFLETVDPLFNEIDKPLSQRPLLAGIHFIDTRVISLSGHAKAEFATSPHFAHIYHHIKAWYDDRYGPMMRGNPSGFALAVVKVLGQPVAVKVPLTTSEVAEEGKTAWLCFPDEVMVSERPLAWLDQAPNLATLTGSQKSALRARIAKTGTALRRVRLHLMGIEPPNPEVDDLLDGVLSALEVAATGIVANTPTSRLGAMWPLQMALERSMKALCLHKTGTFQEIHDLYYLYDFIAAYCPLVNRDKLKYLPNSRLMIDGRYGLAPKPSLDDAMAAYNATLEIVSGIAMQFDQKYRINNLRILLKKPPWTTLPDTEEV
ncbi:HEPN domain-containing protein [Asticcacaulis benevestitus]|uniref:HEPN domain-containing protein n=1 Tax=Asticcacaulis benevestitus DSM 16100 = ATCC BAA-896 TaxID=1121022 RepID=V4Q3V0_9CAUL|nr:HEPN domain-containing protein [Asticcacaulis benevestitus]ESQ92530.1 hypothetical protein ABENE_07795 [Asticcacaulis benevestitus DSM 16100 = ATCC BAA-896]